MANVSKKRQQFGDINITPLTDIFLVLLIIMMVVAPMMNSSNADIKAPELTAGKPIDQSPLSVEVTRDGQYFVDGKPAAAEQLADLMQAKAANMADPKAEKNVTIRADKATRAQAVMAVMEAAKLAAYHKVVVAGEPLSAQRQQELATHAQ